MAFKLVKNAQEYIGTSADTKPTDATVVAGATFYETDTKAIYIYSAAGTWVAM